MMVVIAMMLMITIVMNCEGSIQQIQSSDDIKLTITMITMMIMMPKM